MSSYWDFVQAAAKGRAGGGFTGMLYSMYNELYDNSHGKDRYYLGKFPILNWMRKFDDEAKAAQDSYDNTGVDPAYINRVPDGTGITPTNAVSKAIRMATSLESMYVPEVIEDVSRKFNNMYQ